MGRVSPWRGMMTGRGVSARRSSIETSARRCGSASTSLPARIRSRSGFRGGSAGVISEASRGGGREDRHRATRYAAAPGAIRDSRNTSAHHAMNDESWPFRRSAGEEDEDEAERVAGSGGVGAERGGRAGGLFLREEVRRGRDPQRLQEEGDAGGPRVVRRA